MALAPLSDGYQSLPLLPTIKLGSSGTASWVGGFVYILAPCGSLQGTLLWGWEFLPLLPQPPQVFSISGLKLYFPELEPWVTRSAWLPHCSSPLSVCECGAAGSASWSLACPVPQSTTSLGPPAPALWWVLSTRLPVSAPPTHLDVSSLSPWLSDFHTVRFPVSSGCFLFLIVVLLLFVWGGTVCLPTPPSWPEAHIISIYFAYLPSLAPHLVGLSKSYGQIQSQEVASSSPFSGRWRVRLQAKTLYATFQD